MFNEIYSDTSNYSEDEFYGEDEFYMDECDTAVFSDFDSDLTDLYANTERFSNSLASYGIEMDLVAEQVVM